jgi:L-ribulose-5-phosphate 3-epimerase
MDMRLSRRGFLATLAVTGAGLAAGGRLSAAPSKKALPKALIGAPGKQELKAWKDAGFEGVEWTNWRVLPRDAATTRKSVEALGMRIHSLLFGWGNCNRGDAAMAESVAQMETALRAAEGYGADTVLYVPCKIDGMPMPAPWEFDIRFDPQTGRLKQVVAGDNSRFRQYIEAHDHADQASRETIRRLIPIAEKTRVIVAVENVSNNLWVMPEIFATFVASFKSPWVKAYFDIGNHVEYAPSQDWIHRLGDLTVKCHVKDFKLKPDGHGGDCCHIREGSVDWPTVRKALDDVSYSGWMTIEDEAPGAPLPLDEQNKRLEAIIAEKGRKR